MSKVEELLKNYLSYRHAVLVYERHKPMPSAGIANYSGMPSGSGAPERFFAIVGKPADMGYTSDEDHADYIRYKTVVTEIEGAMETLTEEQQSIIKLKWMHDVTLKQIAKRKYCGETTIRKNHRIAMSRLNDALRFTKLEEIEKNDIFKIVSL
jgi:hypothetical protein